MPDPLNPFTPPDIVPVVPTPEELLRNAIADQAIEGLQVTPAEADRVAAILRERNGGRK